MLNNSTMSITYYFSAKIIYNYHCQEGYVLPSICPCVGLFVCEQLH